MKKPRYVIPKETYSAIVVMVCGIIGCILLQCAIWGVSGMSTTVKIICFVTLVLFELLFGGMLYFEVARVRKEYKDTQSEEEK